jgi:anti-anti-sigma regulatory factor
VTPLPGQPDLSELVDPRAGLIRARGRLTEQGADLLWGTADSLRGTGHTRVVLDLSGIREADSAGLETLDRLRRSFRAHGDQLLITHRPARIRC